MDRNGLIYSVFSRSAIQRRVAVPAQKSPGNGSEIDVESQVFHLINCIYSKIVQRYRKNASASSGPLASVESIVR